MNIKITKRHPAAKVPEYKTEGASCFDICAADSVLIRPHTTEAVPTGLSFEVPEGHTLLIFARSGYAMHGVSLANSVGVIDSDYRGELKVLLRYNGSLGCIEVKPGDRIAQGMIVPIPAVRFEVVEELSETSRGEGGFGSTGT